MQHYEAYIIDKTVAEKFTFIVAQQMVDNLTVSVFEKFGYHIDYECPYNTQKRILVYIDNDDRLRGKVNWV